MEKFLETKNLIIAKELVCMNFECRYFELNMKLSIKRIIAQIRLAVKYNSAIYIGKVKIELNRKLCCKICNCEEAWTIRNSEKNV